MTRNDNPPGEPFPPTSKKTVFNRLPSKWLLVIVLAVVLTGWLLNTPPGLEGKSDAVGYAVCHQIFERSFKINGQPISLCARCTGMYVGVLLGLVYQLLLGRRRSAWPERKFQIVLAIFFIAFGIDGINSAAKLFLQHGLIYEPNNTLRLLTGTGMGLTMAAVILPTFNQTAWKQFSPDPYFQDWKQFGGMVAVGYTSAGLILTELPAILISFTIIGVLGVLAILMLLYTMLWMVVLRRENQVNHTSQLIPWILGGLITAFVHIALLDLGRFWLTGTWEGFHLEIG